MFIVQKMFHFQHFSTTVYYIPRRHNRHIEYRAYFFRFYNGSAITTHLPYVGTDFCELFHNYFSFLRWQQMFSINVADRPVNQENLKRCLNLIQFGICAQPFLAIFKIDTQIACNKTFVFLIMIDFFI